MTVEFTRSNGMFAVEKTFITVNEFGEAKWVTYDTGVKILKVTAVPQAAGLPVTAVF